MAPKSGGDIIAPALLFLLFLSQNPNLPAAFWVFTGPPTVSICPRKDALLVCLFLLDDMQRPNMTELGVLWSRDGVPVLQYDEGGVRAFRLGAYLQERELEIGNASLTLYDVLESDCGNYICQVDYLRERGNISLELELRDINQNPEECAWIMS